MHHELVDAEMIHQADMVVGVGIPGPVGLERACRLAGIGVAQVGGDDAIFAAELGERIIRRLLARKACDGRVQTTSGDHQQRIARAFLFVMNANGTFLVKAHRGSSLCLRQHLRCCGHCGCCYTRGQYVASR